MSKTNPPVRLLRITAYASAALTFVLMIVGGVVRVSESGLGCGPARSGTHGWPLCGGRVIPGVDTNMIIEYTHRILVASLSVILLGLFVLAFLYFRNRPWILRLSLVTLALLFGQAVLGALTVEYGLTPALVAIHLGVAMLTLGLLLMLCRLTRQAETEPKDRPDAPIAPRAIRTLAIVALAFTLGTIVAGGYTASGDLRGSSPEQARTEAVDAHQACGRQFPACNDAFMPFGESKPVDIQLTHRAFMYITSILIVALFVVTMRRRKQLDPAFAAALGRRAWIMLAVLLSQVLLGAINIWAGEQEWLIVLHLTVGTILWGAMVEFTMSALGLQLPAAAGERSKARAQQAVPA